MTDSAPLATAPSGVRPVAFVTGATGAVGPRLVRRLAGEGYRVRVLARQAPPPGLLPDGVEVIAGDLADADALRRGANGASALFHLAARLHVNNPGPTEAAAYRAVNVDGTVRLVEAARQGGAGRVVYFSTINVYGASRPGAPPFEERDAALADGLYAATKREAEAAVRDAGGVALRVAAVYGPRMRGNWPQLVRAVRGGVVPLVGGGANRRTLIHVDDLCTAALLAARHEAAPGGVFNATDGAVHRLRDVVGAIAAALGKRPLLLPLPPAPTRAAAAAADAALALAGRRPMAGALVEKLAEDVAVSGEALQRALGFRPRYGLQEGWADALRTSAEGSRDEVGDAVSDNAVNGRGDRPAGNA